MKLKNTLLVTVVNITTYAFMYGQVSTLPPLTSDFDNNTNNVKLSQIFENYSLVKSNDSSSYQLKKTFDRWMYDNLTRLSIENDSVYGLKDYHNVMKNFVQSDLYCNTIDPSNWTDIGPRFVGQKNGWVSAVWANSTDINQLLIGTRIGGIFKSDNHGENWYSVTDQLPFPVLGVKQIVQKPNDPNYLIAVIGAAQRNKIVSHRLPSVLTETACTEFIEVQ
jgi:hypothetical protein